MAATGESLTTEPVLAQTTRLVVVAGIGFWLTATSAPAWMVFALVGVGMVAYGVSAALTVLLTPWGPGRAAG